MKCNLQAQCTNTPYCCFDALFEDSKVTIDASSLYQLECV